MDEFTPRKLMFKAWDTEAKLLMRLNSIECRKGELVKKDHIILQFTGLYDMEGDEVYEMDILLKGNSRYLVLWDSDRNGWVYTSLPDRRQTHALSKEFVGDCKRLWSFFESDRKN